MGWGSLEKELINGTRVGLAGTPLARAKCNLPVYCPRPASSLNFALNPQPGQFSNLKSTMNARGAHISRAEPNGDWGDDPSEAPYPSQAGCHTPLHTPEPQFPSCLICTRRGRLADALPLQSSLHCRKIFLRSRSWCRVLLQRITAREEVVFVFVYLCFRVFVFVCYCRVSRLERKWYLARHQILHNSRSIASSLPPISSSWS